MTRVGDGLRLCSLDRACGEEVADAVGGAALEQAVTAALRLPSRFPSAAALHRSGVYFQAAKVRSIKEGVLLWGTMTDGLSPMFRLFALALFAKVGSAGTTYRYRSTCGLFDTAPRCCRVVACLPVE